MVLEIKGFFEMRRFFSALLLLSACVLPLWAQTPIASIPNKLADRYDVSWTMTVNAALKAPLQFIITQPNGDATLQITADKISWQPAGAKSPTISAPVSFAVGSSYSIGIKRRPDTMAVLFQHRLLFSVPMPAVAGEKIAFAAAPDSIAITDARYRKVGAPKLGDDFMRKDAVSGVTAGTTAWVEDSTWEVQYYQVDNPGAMPPKDTAGAPIRNPWRLSLFPMTETTANGFWFLYTGIGPSWTIGNNTMSYPFWDKYYVQAAVKPDFDSTVGLVAAYQDNKNYLVFRWKQREYDTAVGHRAQLIAVIDGVEKLIAESDRGFEPGQWSTVRINLGWQQAQVLIDGQLLLQGANPGNIEGRAGMYADGVAKPRRINPDETTVKMYEVTDPNNPNRKTNDSTLSQDDGTLIYFDDVKVGDWAGQENTLPTGGYVFDKTGGWDTRNNVFSAMAAGRYLTGSYANSSYRMNAALTANGAGAGLYFHMDSAGNGYLWDIAGGKHLLKQVANYIPTATVATATLTDTGKLNLRVEADGTYVALYCNDVLVLDYYDATITKGRIGLWAEGKGAVFTDFTVAALESRLNKVKVHNKFAVDRYMAAWATEDGEWYPVAVPTVLLTPAGIPFATAGAASPFPTNVPGLYWHKAAHYHDFRITLPYQLSTLAGQKIYFADKYDAASGYTVEINAKDGKGIARLSRLDKLVGEYTFAVTAKSQLVFERKGTYYLLHAQDLDVDITDSAVVTNDTLLFAYHDDAPLPATMIGFNVTTAGIKASDAHIETEGVMDAFEVSPTGWVAESGIWAVMQKFSCQPQWNWYGGFGGGNPTVWSKYKLEGDSVVEVFEGVKMAVDAAVSDEQYALRYRDMNMTFCADGKHINSGYSVIRGGRLAGQPTTMLLREGKVVMTSVKPEDLLPPQSTGHRVWFATRVEKRGLADGKAEIRVYIDNHLAMTYVDDKPLTGGYVAFWTHNNGMMIARANIFAEKMTVGEPRAAAPLTMKDEDMTPFLTPVVTMNGTPLVMADFENGKDGFVERPGIIGGRILRDSSTDGRGVTNHFLRVINSYPSGDFSVSLPPANVDLLKTPNLHFDYNLDMGVKVNLYLRLNNKWYEVMLTGKPAQSEVYTLGKVPAVADGSWHHFEANVGKMLTEAITKQANVAPTALILQELIIADWSSNADMRDYGFNLNNGGKSYCLDNITTLPTVTDKVTLSWANDKLKDWRTGVDNTPINAPTTAATTAQVVLTPKQTLQFFHLQGTDTAGKPGGIVNIPIPGVAGN